MTSHSLERGKLISTKAVVKELYHMARWFVNKKLTTKPGISVNRNFFTGLPSLWMTLFSLAPVGCQVSDKGEQ